MDTLGYCMRVDALDGYSEKISMLPACTDYLSIVAVKHKGNKGENPHFHLVVRTEVAQQAFRVRMRKIFDQGKGNGHMSIRPWDGCIDAVSYLFHEDPDSVLLLQHQVSDATISEAKARNREVAALVNASRDKASWRLEEVVSSQLSKVEGFLSDSYIGQQLILAALRHGKYVPQPWLVRAMTERIQFRRLNGSVEAEEDFALRLSRQIFYRE